MKLLIAGMLITSLFLGNHKYQIKDYENAKKYFNKSKAAKSLYNMGNSQYRLGEYTDAIENWDRVIEGDNSPKLKFSSFYNSGNAYFKQGDLKKAEENYLNALNIRPYDEDARYNLELTRKRMKEEEKKKEERGSGKTDKEKQENEGNDTEKPEKIEDKKHDDQSETLEEAGAKKKGDKKLSKMEKDYLERLAKAEKRYRGKYLDKIPKNDEDVQKQMMKQMDEEGYFLDTRDW